MAVTSITVSSDYLWVVAVALAVTVQCWMTGFAMNRRRQKYFTKEFFEKNFPGLKTYPKDGYPDNGSGIFSAKLSVEQWLDLNNASRAHMNYVEGVTLAVLSILASGLASPRLAVVCGIAYIIGRQLYTIGYLAKGGTGRYVGVLIVDLALGTMFGYAFYQLYHLAGGCNALISLVTGAKY